MGKEVENKEVQTSENKGINIAEEIKSAVKSAVDELKAKDTVDEKKRVGFNTSENISLGESIWKVYNNEEKTIELKSTGVISSATLGGNVAPTLPGNSLYQSPNEFGLARRICRIVPVNGKAQDFYTGTDLATYTTAEAAAMTGTNFVYGKVTLTPARFAGDYIFSKDLEQDAVINLQNDARIGFQKALNAQEDALLISRIEALPNANTLTASVTGNITASVTSLDIFPQLIAGVEGNNAAFENGCFICNPTVYWYFFQLKKTTGDPMIDFNTATQTLYIYGKPVYKTNKMAGVTTTTSGKTVLAYGDFNYMLFGDRGVYNFEVAREATVGGVNLWAENCIAIKSDEKVDIQPVDDNAFMAYELK
ncbi:MAG: phage major capsid protein [Ignavibacteria bacterium]|nr:phage major capsid protein [Ignavibacteria bacterium]